MGYPLTQVYSGYSDTCEGHILEGDLHSYGLVRFIKMMKKSEEYIDDFTASEFDAKNLCFKD